jgi:hypothetical protein
MMWADRIALGLLELLLIAIVLLVAINLFSSAFPLTADRAYGLFIGGAFLVILPLWLVLRIAERRGRRRR